MTRRILLYASFWCLFLSTGTLARAQGLQVSTQVYDISRGESQTAAPVVSSSLSLMHNGRVYDYVDAADEVVIFDPSEKRFTVLNMSRNIATQPTLEEIRHMLNGLEPGTRAYLEDQVRFGDDSSIRMSESIHFQLNPRFSESFDPMRGTLVLASESFTYRVETRRWAETEQVERYLTWADWTAQLNAVLHPGSLFPKPRMALNEALRKHGNRMPVSVELDMRPNVALRLRAVHRYTTPLSDDAHQRIARWEQAMTSKKIRDVSFRSYQEAVLISKSP